MKMFDQWQDIVIYPQDPDRIHSASERLDTRSATHYSKLEPGKEKMLVRIDFQYFREFGDFEKMEIGDYGDVTLWTTTHVCGLRRQFGMEKFICMLRNPPSA